MSPTGADQPDPNKTPMNIVEKAESAPRPQS